MISRVAHDVLHGELQVDDVLVVGQHQRFLEHARLDVVAIADLERADLREIDDLVRLDRPRHAPAQPGARLLRELAERQHDAALALDDDVEAACEPHREDDARKQARTAEAGPGNARRLAASTAPPAEELGEAPVEVAPELVQVGRALISAAWAAGTSLAAPVGVVQRHFG